MITSGAAPLSATVKSYLEKAFDVVLIEAYG